MQKKLRCFQKVLAVCFWLFASISPVCNAQILEKKETFEIDFSKKIYSRLHNEGRTLLSEYAQAYLNIRHFYRNMQMNVIETYYRNSKEFFSPPQNLPTLSVDNPLDVIRKIRIEVRYNDEIDVQKKIDAPIVKYTRVDKQFLFAAPDPRDAKSAKAAHEFNQNDSYPRLVSIGTPERCYDLSKAVQKQYYSVIRKRSFDDYWHDVLYFPNAPYASGHVDLEHILLSPPDLTKKNPPISFYIDYVKPVIHQGHQMIEIKHYTDTQGKYTADPFVRYTFFRDTWVIDNIYGESWVSKNGQHRLRWWSKICTYSGKKDGMPLLKTVEQAEGFFEDNDPNKRKITKERTVWEITNLIPGAVNLSEFDVYQFLPPKVKIGEVTPAFPAGRVVGIIIGVILILFGIYLKFRDKKKG